VSSTPAGFVLDTSVALAAFFEDEQDDYSLAVWRSMPAVQPHVPALWHLEVGNILSRALKARRITGQALQECWARLAVVGIRTLPVAGEAAQWAQRATDWGLSAYDACYLDTALRQRLALATRDKGLAEAARRVGVPLYLQSAAAA
jgi:predicted nucleic acid-binding protein